MKPTKPIIIRLKYSLGKCEKAPFQIVFSQPITARDLYLPELPKEIQFTVNDVLTEMYLTGYENYLRKAEAEKFGCYS